jgi:hypothetical protein
VVLDGERKLYLSDYDYLRDQQTAVALEVKAAAKAREIGAFRWVLAVPQVWVFEPPGSIWTRAVTNHPLRENEQEAITWTSFDLNDGLDYGRVAYTRQPSGELVFEEPEMFMVEVWPTDTMPGAHLRQAFFADDE